MPLLENADRLPGVEEFSPLRLRKALGNPGGNCLRSRLQFEFFGYLLLDPDIIAHRPSLAIQTP